MQLITKINNAANQRFTIIGANGEQIEFHLYYLPTQQQWAFDCSYGTWSCNGMQLVVSPNVLRMAKNLIPFGFLVTSKDGLDPFYINDFVSGRIKIYLLTAAETLQIEAALF